MTMEPPKPDWMLAFVPSGLRTQIVIEMVDVIVDVVPACIGLE